MPAGLIRLMNWSVQSKLCDAADVAALYLTVGGDVAAFVSEISDWIGARQNERGGDFDRWRAPLIELCDKLAVQHGKGA